MKKLRDWRHRKPRETVTRGKAMASATSTQRLKEEITCSICMDMMTKPVSIDCGHIFCYKCISTLIDKIKKKPPNYRSFLCPLCSSPFRENNIHCVKQFQNLIETIKEMSFEKLCKEHGEKLQLFCEDDYQLLCWRCERSPQHKGHATALVEDVSPGYREKFQKVMTDLRQLAEECLSWKTIASEKITEWKEKIQLQKEKIQFDFNMFYTFLKEEEKFYLSMLEAEEKRILQILEEDEAGLLKQNEDIQGLILELQKRCRGSAQDLLQDVNDILTRTSNVKLQLPEKADLEVHTECNVSKLDFSVKKVLKYCEVKLTLDPDTAHKDLHLSRDMRQVKHNWPQQINNSSEISWPFPCVRGSLFFTSGRKYFEVDVGEGTGCRIGVCLENALNGRCLDMMSQPGFWAIELRNQMDCLALTYPPTPLLLDQKLQVVGVFVDFEAGLVSFYNSETDTRIFTFPKTSFSGKLRPFFGVIQDSPLVVSPER